MFPLFSLLCKRKVKGQERYRTYQAKPIRKKEDTVKHIEADMASLGRALLVLSPAKKAEKKFPLSIISKVLLNSANTSGTNFRAPCVKG